MTPSASRGGPPAAGAAGDGQERGAADVSVVVPFADAAPYIERAIGALLAQRYPRDRYEIIMVENNSADASPAIARRHPGITVLSEPRPGAYAARNRGAAAAGGAIVVFTDADCAPAPGWLQTMASAFADEGVGVALGRVVSPPSACLAVLSAYEHQRALYIFGGRVAALYYGHTDDMAVRRGLFDRVGPFDEVARGADMVLVSRAARALGPGVVRYLPDAVVEHLEMTGPATWLRKMFIYGRSSRYYRAGTATRNLTTGERLALFRRTVSERGAARPTARGSSPCWPPASPCMAWAMERSGPAARMKVLVVSPYPVLPLTHGGRVRTSRLAAAVARAGARVDVLCPWVPGTPWRPFRRDEVTHHPHAFAANLLPALLGSRLVPPLVALSWQPFRWGPARRLRRFRGYDIAQFDFCAHAAWMERIPPSTRVVYSAHNVECDFARPRTRRSIVGGAALRRLAELERRAVRASALVVTCTAADADRMRELHGGDTPFEVIPNGFDQSLLDGERRRAREALGIAPDQVAIVFVGGPAQHNRDGARFLERELMPRLGSWARLFIAGQCTVGRGERGGGAVRRLGYIEDLKSLYAAGDIAVDPVAYGSGSSVKIAEYLAAGLPVVTTPVGARGYEHLGQRISVASRDEFAAAVERLRPGRGREEPPPRSAVCGPTWTELGRRLHAAYARLIERASRSLPE